MPTKANGRRLRSLPGISIGIAFFAGSLVGGPLSDTNGGGPAEAPAPPRIVKPGDSLVNPSRIAPHERHWKVTLANAQNKIIEYGDWKETVERGEEAGRPVLRRRITLDGIDGKPKERVVLVADARTFAPIRTEEERPDQGSWLRYRFDGRSISGERSADAVGAPSRKIDAKLPLECFDYLGGWMELFFAALPLREGFAVTFPAALATAGPAEPQDGVSWVTARVKGRGPVAAGGGRKIDAWLVEADTPYGYYKVWVADEAPYVIQAMLILGPGGRLSYQPV